MKNRKHNNGTQALFRRTWSPFIKFSLLISLFSALPLIYILYQAAGASIESWSKLLKAKIPVLLFNTICLALVTAAIASIIAFTLAWLIIKTDLPFKKTFHWLAAMPLAIPVYIAAFTYITILGPAGAIPKLISSILNITVLELKFNFIYSFMGVALIFSFFTYPYIYLLLCNSLKNIDGNLEDASISSGLNLRETFRKVILPLITPSIFSGSLLVIIYVMADFGAISMLRFESFTRVIYLQLIGRYDRASATILSSVLVLIIYIFLWIENYIRTRKTLYTSTNTQKSSKVYNLNKWKIPCLLLVLIIFTFTLFIPMATLISWSIKGVFSGVLSIKFFKYVTDSLLLSLITATIVTLIALPVSFVNTRYKNNLYKVISKLAYTGYALPGIITALGTIFIFNRFLPGLYKTLFCLIAAYVIKLLPQCLQGQENTLLQLSSYYEDTSLTLGYKPWTSLRKVTIPLMKGGIISGWVLVFINVTKELPATLLLRPPGFDTMAVRVWIDASEGIYTSASPIALLLIGMSMLTMKFLMKYK